MPIRPSSPFALALLCALALTGAGCGSRNPADLDQARAPIDPLVFDDAYAPDVYFQAFMDTDPYAVGTDSVFVQSGDHSLTITVPPEGSNLGAWAGGVLTAVSGRDLADFNALTFYARASIPCAMDVFGYGNDNTGTSRLTAGRSGIPLTTAWSFVVVPIPMPAKLVSERGMFTFAEGREAGHPEGHRIWIDDIRFARLDNVTDPEPTLKPLNKQYFVGTTARLDSVHTVFAVDGAPVRVDHMPGYFDFSSSDPSVATVVRNEIRMVGLGEAVITATLAGMPVEGAVTVSGYQPPPAPATPPTLPAADVVSLFSGTYADATVVNWNPHWQYSTTEDGLFTIDGDLSHFYTFLNFVGVDFHLHTIDVTSMTHLHLDVYAPAGTRFLVKLVPFSGDNGWGTGSSELAFDASSTPAFVAGGWSSLEIPLADFGFTVPLDHLGQIVLSSPDASVVLVDNVYFHR